MTVRNLAIEVHPTNEDAMEDLLNALEALGIPTDYTQDDDTGFILSVDLFSDTGETISVYADDDYISSLAVDDNYDDYDDYDDRITVDGEED